MHAENTEEDRADTYIAIDLETTGLSAKMNKIIEVGAVKFVEGKETEVFSSYVNPGVMLPERITELTGITQEDLQDAPGIGDILDDLERFLGEEILVGHNLLFDYSFLKRAFTFRKRKFEKRGIDTLKIARACLSQEGKKSLGDLCALYDIPLQAHRAVGDARAAGLLYQRLQKEFGETPALSKCFVPGELVCQIRKDSPVTQPQKGLLYKLHAQYGIRPEYDVEKLTKSEASRHIDRILREHKGVKD